MSVNSLKVLEKLLDFSVANQKVISKNIANVTTVNYKREELKFDNILEDELSADLKLTNSKHIPFAGNNADQVNYQTTKDASTENNSGFNNVDINKEMSDLAENSIMFRFGSKKINSYFQTLQNVIRGGGA